MNQALILILGGAAVWLAASPEARRRRWGYLLGLASQPFWLLESAGRGQWGIFILSCWYAWAWARGLITHWRLS